MSKGVSVLVAEQASFLIEVSRLIRFATAEGWVVAGGDLWRSPEQREICFKSGRSKTMNSNHLRRCAIDLNFFLNGKSVWDKELICAVGECWESLRPEGVGGVEIAATNASAMGWTLSF